MSLSYIWPVLLIICSNTVYQIALKGTPKDINPFASLVVTYLVGAGVCAALYFMLNKEGGTLLKELGKANWATYLLGLIIVGLEAGYVYAYRAGWSVSVAPVVQNAVVSVLLIFVAYGLYKEQITLTKVAGIACCLLGVILLNK